MLRGNLRSLQQCVVHQPRLLNVSSHQQSFIIRSTFSTLRTRTPLSQAPVSQSRLLKRGLQQLSKDIPQPGAERQAKPAKQRGQSKLYKSADEAVADLKSGSTILSAGFGICGTADTIIEAMAKRSDFTDLKAVSNNTGANGYGLDPLVQSGQITSVIMSYVGGNKTLEKKYLEGNISVELCPQGTIAERIRCGGAGIPGFYTPTGVATAIQFGDIPIRYGPKDDKGKRTIVQPGNPRETKIFDGKLYNLEHAIKGDIAIVRAHKVDKAGNVVFRGTTKSFGKQMARAATITIVEAENIVEVGELDPSAIDIPGLFVDRICPSTREKKIEILKLREDDDKPSEADNSPAEVRRKRIAKRAALELQDGFYVNLGVGMPTLAASYIPEGRQVWLQSENGLLGMGPYPTQEQADPDYINAGKETVTVLPGASIFDSSDSFAMIRGGHVDVSMLGALEVDSFGNLANYMIPEKLIKGMGGAMDLVSNPDGTKIICLTDHVDKNGKPKILHQCKLPLTGAKVVSTIITDLCVFQVDRFNGGLTLTELAPGVEVEEIKEKTGADFKVAKDIKRME